MFMGNFGEVKGICILIYEVDEEKALETLKHEFLDYVISKTMEPLRKNREQIYSNAQWRGVSAERKVDGGFGQTGLVEGRGE